MSGFNGAAVLQYTATISFRVAEGCDEAPWGNAWAKITWDKNVVETKLLQQNNRERTIKFPICQVDGSNRLVLSSFANENICHNQTFLHFPGIFFIL